jgi:hypothetical protein
MTLLPRGVKVHLAAVSMDMHKALMVSRYWSRACCGTIRSQATALRTSMGPTSFEEVCRARVLDFCREQLA